MKTSEQGIKFIIAREGKENCQYHDTKGLLTIGVGHLLTDNELATGYIMAGSERILWRHGITDSQVLSILARDLVRFEKAVSAVAVPLNQHQFDALVSFCFNIGTGAFMKSTLLRNLNHGDYAGVPAQLMRWTKQKELVGRREKEVRLFRDGVY